MKYTSSQVGKMLRKLNDDHAALLKKEEMSKDFLVSLGENADSVRPEYDFLSTQKELEEFMDAHKELIDGVDGRNFTRNCLIRFGVLMLAIAIK